MISPTLVANTSAKRSFSPVASPRADSPTKIRRRFSWSSSNDSLDDDRDNNSTNDFPNSDVQSNSQKIREALTGEFPELKTLYSDAYLDSVAGVPGRSLSYAINHNIRRSLEWRRAYGVEALREAFEVGVDGEDIPKNNDDDQGKPSSEKSGVFVPRRCFVASHNSNTSKISMSGINNANKSSFFPTPELVHVCSSGAFVILDEELICTDFGMDGEQIEKSRRLVVYANTSRLNWWKTGITAGLQYHVLVLEEALERIRNNRRCSNTSSRYGEEQRTNSMSDMELEESIVICVDTTAPPFLPPPLGVLKGMTQLLQKAYPDRIHKIFVGPVSPWLRALYERIRPFLKPRSRDKIVLLGESPSLGTVARWQSN